MDITTTERPWGSFTRFTNNQLSTVKLLYIRKGEQLSLQYHEHREEFWHIIAGHPEVTIGEDVHQSSPGDEMKIGVHVPHRISAPTDDCVILEISTGEFDEDDIVRLEDKYNRAP